MGSAGGEREQAKHIVLVLAVRGPAQRATRATDPALARRLWDVSIEMTGVDPNLMLAP